MKTQSSGNYCACSVMHFSIPCAPPYGAIWGEKVQASSAPCDAMPDGSLPIFSPLDLNMVGVRVVLQGPKKNKENFEFSIPDLKFF